MCGEIQEWQEAKTVFVRLTGSGAQQNVVIGNKFDNVEEVWVDEVMVTGFNGGVSAAAYLNVTINGMHPGSANNEAKPGVLVMVDVLNPHTVYQRPRVVAKGHMVSVNTLKVSLNLPSGVAATFTEAAFTLTLVCRKTADQLEEVRRLKASVDYAPSIRDGMARQTFDPNRKP